MRHWLCRQDIHDFGSNGVCTRLECQARVTPEDISRVVVPPLPPFRPYARQRLDDLQARAGDIKGSHA